MTAEIISDRQRDIGSCRSQNSLAWAGFALTNFVTIAALYSVFEVEWSIIFQIASYLFLLSGTFFAVGWGLYETVGSEKKINLAKNTKWFSPFRPRNWKKDEYAKNPRNTYIKQAEITSIVGTCVWFIGVTLLLWDLGMPIIGLAWFLTAFIFWLWSVPRFYFWKEDPSEETDKPNESD